jgi:osmotically-inducible protein OsmY
MKTRIITLTVALLGAGLPTLTITGCAGGPTAKSTGEFIDDAALTAKVKAEFVRDPIVSAMAVNVDTFKGTVQLNGFVDNEQQRMRAEQIARNVPGVQNVDNKLSLKTATR